MKDRLEVLDQVVWAMYRRRDWPYCMPHVAKHGWEPDNGVERDMRRQIIGEWREKMGFA